MELRIAGLSKTYANGTRALDDVSLEIPAGMFGLLGPNGAGKSTLMRILATLQEADAGSIRLGELDVRRQPAEVRRVLGYLPQEFGVYPQVSCGDLLDHFAVLKGVTNRQQRAALVEHLLVRTNLWEVRKQRLGGFSGGMRQRFGVAVALIGDPRLIIVDEPTAGLDPAERVRFLNLLAELGETAVIILSTHIVDDVAELCPRLAIIERGRIAYAGTTEDAVRSVQGQVWRTTVDRGAAAGVAAAHRLLGQRWQGGRVQLRVLAEVCPGTDFVACEPTLADAYFAALGAAAVSV